MRILILLLCSFSLFSQCTTHSELIRARHIEPNGIGYDKGYTTLDFLLSIPNKNRSFVPLLDLRGHVFNNAKMAANAGLVFRWIGYSAVAGFNVYYDYRDTEKQHYNQVSTGIELLGCVWDFRMNGYLPIGWKRTHPFDFFFEMNPDDSFVLTAKREFAMPGADAEMGYHFQRWKGIDFYLTAGPYYYHAGRFGDEVIGGRVRAFATFWTILTLEGNTSYDAVYHWIGQGGISLNLPLGSRKARYRVEERAVQPVGHNEIIVVEQKRKSL